MELNLKAAHAVLVGLFGNGAKRATKYLSDRQTVRVQRVLYNGKIDRRDRRVTVVMTFGEPNYEERQFIKKCKKAGEPFPVKKVQFKFPARRTAGRA